jgi:hypothetical protein
MLTKWIGWATAGELARVLVLGNLLVDPFARRHSRPGL